jgi:hypothetical protein
MCITIVGISPVGGQVVLAGAALLVKLVFERDYSEHTTDLLCATVGQEEILLRLTCGTKGYVDKPP